MTPLPRDNSLKMDRTPKASKRVRFSNEDKTVFFEADIQKEQWYSRQDYRDWKRAFREEAREFRHKGFGVLLKDAFERPPRDIQQQITAFALLDGENYLRGIEQYLNKQHDKERVSLKQQTIQGILSHQRVMKHRGHLSPDELAQELSFLNQEYSRPARRFAERIGVADEYVVKFGSDASLATNLVVKLLEGEKKSCYLTRWNSSDSTERNVQMRRPVRRPEIEQALLDETSSKDIYGNDSCRALNHRQDDSFRSLDPQPTDDAAAIIRQCPSSPACPMEEFIHTSQRHLLGLPSPA